MSRSGTTMVTDTLSNGRWKLRTGQKNHDKRGPRFAGWRTPCPAFSALGTCRKIDSDEDISTCDSNALTNLPSLNHLSAFTISHPISTEISSYPFSASHLTPVLLHLLPIHTQSQSLPLPIILLLRLLAPHRPLPRPQRLR